MSNTDQQIDGVINVVRRDRPDIATEPIRLIYTGFSNHVLTTGSNFIVRIARTPDAAATHTREYELLQKIQRHVGIDVPRPVWRTAGSRYSAMAYERITGTSLRRDSRPRGEVVEQLARFLSELHCVRDAAVTKVVAPLTEWRDGTLSVTRAAVDQLVHELSGAEYARLRDWHTRYVAMVRGVTAERATVVHGDFWHDNILTIGDRVVSVLDWESAAIADPAVDLAPVWDIDADLGARILAGYENRDPSLPDRVRMFRVARNIGGITWSIDNNDPTEYADSLVKVRSVLPLL